MYKAPKSKKGVNVKKEWPYAYCRNEACELFGMDQATRVSTSASKNRPKRAVAKAPTSAKSTIKELVAEHPAVEKARARISQIIRGNGAGPLDANMVGLALTLLSQQVGSFKAANALIDDFDLNKEYGIQKIDVD